ncbi:DUF1187 family protein [Salmonella enterica]|nr:DUF1187 family protein [Salmonella enterica]EGI0930529.1 DUF1187 family protein [Salmonella enterica]
MYKYRITAIVKKPGNSPTNWVRFSDKKMNKAECEKMLSGTSANTTKLYLDERDDKAYMML